MTYPLSRLTTIEFHDGTIISKPGNIAYIDCGMVGFDVNGYDAEYYNTSLIKKVTVKVTSWYVPKEK